MIRTMGKMCFFCDAGRQRDGMRRQSIDGAREAPAIANFDETGGRGMHRREPAVEVRGCSQRTQAGREIGEEDLDWRTKT
jgi:hypothetical protein